MKSEGLGFEPLRNPAIVAQYSGYFLFLVLERVLGRAFAFPLFDSGASSKKNLFFLGYFPPNDLIGSCKIY